MLRSKDCKYSFNKKKVLTLDTIVVFSIFIFPCMCTIEYRYNQFTYDLSII